MRPVPSTEAKAFAQLAAEAAYHAGAAIVPTTDDHDRPVYVVNQGALTQQFPDLAAAAGWLAATTGAQRHQAGRVA